MTFVKYQVKDNSFGQLLAGISAVTTSIVLKTGNGANLPAITSPNNPSVLTLVQVDGTGAIIKNEQVLCTNRASDTLTVTRGFAGTTAQAFDADDYIYLYQTATVTQDMQNEIERLEDDKLDTSTFNSTLRNNLGNRKIIYTNATGDETELPLGSSGQYLRSTGVNTAPEFSAPPLDINGQTTDNGALASDDYLIYYDTSEGANNKRVAKASTTVEGLVEIATDEEDKTGTDETRCINAKQNRIVYGGTIVTNTTSRDNTATGTTTGTTQTITTRTVAKVTMSASSFTTSTLQHSTDGTSWSTLYQILPSGSAIDAIIMLAPNHYYRGIVTTTATGGGVGGTVTIQYTS